MILVAHRGLSELYGDNNLQSFQKAIESQKYEGIEMDIQLAPWNEIIVNHDLVIDNYSDGYINFEHLINELNAPPEIKIFLDIKGTHGIVSHLEELFNKNPMWSIDQFVVCSFNIKTLKKFCLPFDQCFISDNVFRESDLDIILDNRMKYFSIHWGALDNETMDYCRRKNIKVLVYTPVTQSEKIYTASFKPYGMIVNQ